MEKIQRRHLLVCCEGAGIAMNLEEHGCLRPASAIWTAMIQEAPSDPRWYFLAARNLLARGKLERARQQLVNHQFLSGDRAEALLDQATMLLTMGFKRQAARRAVEAMSFIKDGARLEQARSLLKRSGVRRPLDRP